MTELDKGVLVAVAGVIVWGIVCIIVVRWVAKRKH